MPLSRKKKDEDEIVLSYHDAVLRSSDLQILRGPFFLNDRLIEFYFAHLAAAPVPSALRLRLLLVPPSLSFWLANCPDNALLLDSVAPLRLPEKDLVLLTVNDNSDLSLAEGGSHWSLLVYFRPKNEFVHLDSIQGMNRCDAWKLYEALRAFVGGEGEARFVDGVTPQQNNGYDCGVFVMAIAKVVCDWYLKGGCSDDNENTWFSALEEEVNANTVDRMRAHQTGLKAMEICLYQILYQEEPEKLSEFRILVLDAPDKLDF